MTTKVSRLLSKMESRQNRDVVIVRVPFKDIKNMRDMDDATKISKTIHTSNNLSGFKVTDVESVIDGDKKELRIMIDIEGRVDHRRVQDEVKKLFK